jgi:predicted RNA-binding Zn-ribbon protein involved in translation (DUF1610 family)
VTYTEIPTSPTHEFFCHYTGEILKTSSYGFYYCPSCGQLINKDYSDGLHDLIEI